MLFCYCRVALPDEPCIWKMDLETGDVVPLLKYTDFATFQPRPEMQESGSVHKVNHLMLSPDGNRFMVLYRWFVGQRKYTRLVTCDIDGRNMYVLSDDDMVSHCFWKDHETILAFENKKDGGPGYYLMKDKTQDYRAEKGYLPEIQRRLEESAGEDESFQSGYLRAELLALLSAY